MRLNQNSSRNRSLAEEVMSLREESLIQLEQQERGEVIKSQAEREKRINEIYVAPEQLLKNIKSASTELIKKLKTTIKESVKLYPRATSIKVNFNYQNCAETIVGRLLSEKTYPEDQFAYFVISKESGLKQISSLLCSTANKNPNIAQIQGLIMNIATDLYNHEKQYKDRSKTPISLWNIKSKKCTFNITETNEQVCIDMIAPKDQLAFAAALLSPIMGQLRTSLIKGNMKVGELESSFRIGGYSGTSMYSNYSSILHVNSSFLIDLT